MSKKKPADPAPPADSQEAPEAVTEPTPVAEEAPAELPGQREPDPNYCRPLN